MACFGAQRLRQVTDRATSRDAEQSQKYDSMVQNLIDNGYPEPCVDSILKYAANNLWKD